MTPARDLRCGDVISTKGISHIAGVGYPIDLIQIDHLSGGSCVALYWGAGPRDGTVVSAKMEFEVLVRAHEWCDV